MTLGLAARLLYAQGAPRILPLRAFYMTNYGGDQATALLDTAAKSGLNGILLNFGADWPVYSYSNSPEVLDLIAFGQLAAQRGLEVIPQIFSVGYAGGLLERNPELAEGFLVQDALFVADQTVANYVSELTPVINNADFEQTTGTSTLIGWTLDEPGKRGFVDTTIAHSGKTSARLEVVPDVPGRSMVSQDVAVKPHRIYQLSVWLKTENVDPVDDCVFVQTVAPDGHDLTPFDLYADGNGDWTLSQVEFNSWGNDKVTVRVGSTGCTTGKIWVDDFKITELSLINILHRDGTPFTVTGDQTGVVYTAGKDYQLPVDPNRNFQFDHDGPPIALLPGGAIKPGTRLRVSYYQGQWHNSWQVSVCLSEPALYKELQQIVQLTHDYLKPKRYLLAFSEIRAGGSCDACKKSGLSTAQIFGDSLTKQLQIIRAIDPSAEILVYSDMIDQNHNAVDNYYLVDGELTDIWKYIPKDLTLLPWYYEIRDQSIAFLGGKGYRIVGGAHYDAPDLQQSHDWYRSLTASPQGTGIAYYTWAGDYHLLGPFGEMVSAPFTEMLSVPRPPRRWKPHR